MVIDSNLRRRKDAYKHMGGFTIVELLIVVVVIAILAAITIVSYNGISQRAKVSAATSSARQAQSKIESFFVLNADVYPANLTEAGLASTDGTNYQYRVDNTATPKTYCLTATTQNLSYFVSNSSRNPSAGACSGHGANGAQVITNYHTNPGTINGWGGYSSYAGTNNARNDSQQPANWASSGSAIRTTWTILGQVNSGDISVVFGAEVAAGEKHTVVYKLRGPPRTSTVKAPEAYSSSGNITVHARSHTNNSNLTANEVQTRWVTFTADQAAINAAARSVNTLYDKVAGDYLEISDVIIYRGDYNPNIGWASGSTPGWAWNGTPNNATSSGPIIQ